MASFRTICTGRDANGMRGGWHSSVQRSYWREFALFLRTHMSQFDGLKTVSKVLWLQSK